MKRRKGEGDAPIEDARAKKVVKQKEASTRIFVGNLPYTSTAKALKNALMSTEGCAEYVEWLTDKSTGLFYGSAFVEMESVKAAKRAVERASKGLLSLQQAGQKEKRILRVGFNPVKEGEVWPPETHKRETPPVACTAGASTVNVVSSSVVQAFGESLITADGMTKTTEALKGVDIIGVYFSAQWCTPCKRFTPKLAKAYAGLKVTYSSVPSMIV